MVRVPTAHPKLPDYQSLAPYLQAIDETRIYSNFGPLQDQLAQRLRLRIFQDEPFVLPCANGTVAFIAAISAVQKRWKHRGQLALVTGHSFVSTAAATRFCGFTNEFVDVDPSTWGIDPSALKSHPKIDLAGLVVVTMPYGRAIDLEAWQDFQDMTGIPVVIDGAASFESFASGQSIVPSSIPIMLSLHATKSFSSGEGGIVLTHDLELMAAARCSINHGFLGSRRAQMYGQNGKMSEYHAAVGLAELDHWEEKSAAFLAVSDHYRHHWSASGCQGRLWAAPDVAGCYVLYEAPTKQQAQDCLTALDGIGVDARRWYGNGLHTEPAFQNGKTPDDLAVTSDLCARLIGLPCFTDLPETEISRLLKAIP